MATEKEIQQLKVALNLTGGFSINKFGAETILEVQSSIKEMGDSFDLKTACQIIERLNEKYNANRTIEQLIEDYQIRLSKLEKEIRNDK